MKLTKRIAAIAATAIMTMTSAVSMNTSANEDVSNYFGTVNLQDEDDNQKIVIQESQIGTYADTTDATKSIVISRSKIILSNVIIEGNRIYAEIDPYNPKGCWWGLAAGEDYLCKLTSGNYKVYKNGTWSKGDTDLTFTTHGTINIFVYPPSIKWTITIGNQTLQEII